MRVLTMFAAMLVAGCATTTGTGPTVSHSGFDNAKTVAINPHGTDCSSFTCLTLGAQWNAKAPADALLIVGVTSTTVYAGIVGAQLNIDGKVVNLTPTATVTSMTNLGTTMRESTKGFATDIATIRAVTQAQRVWLRIQTPTGSMESAVIDGARDSKAYHALKRFLAAVDAG